MTIGEANAINVLLKFLLEAPGHRPTIKEVDDAGSLLAKRAHKTLYAGFYAGYDEADWREKWKARTKP